MKPFLFLIALLFSQGCENKTEVYSRFLTQEAVMPMCLAVDPQSSTASTLVKVLEESGFTVREGCPFRAALFKNYAACPPEKNPDAARGFIRMELQQSGRTLYQVQREFFDEGDEEVMSLLSERMARELKGPREPR